MRHPGISSSLAGASRAAGNPRLPSGRYPGARREPAPDLPEPSGTFALRRGPAAGNYPGVCGRRVFYSGIGLPSIA